MLHQSDGAECNATPRKETAERRKGLNMAASQELQRTA